MSEKFNGLNLPAIQKGVGLSKDVKKEISSLDLTKKSEVNRILNSESPSIQKKILQEESGLDLVLVGDLTASMHVYHKLLKDNFKLLCKDLFALIPNMRIGIIFYLDHDSHLPYVTRVSKLSKDIEQLYHFIETTPVSTDGNSTFDEAVEDAFNDVVSLNWREVGSRSVVLFGDAQPMNHRKARMGTVTSI
ncbi:MAG: VWA domain-containing protein [Bacteroidetes bacterium]|nr:VWA domain-containing protein [Bacteroidota bacterium]